MYYKAILTIFISFICVTGFAQYTATAFSICVEGGIIPDSTILFIKQYNAKNLLVKEINNTATEHQQSRILSYEYTSDALLKKEVDSSQFRKVIKEYFYKEGKITKVLEIIFTLSTENFNYREPLFPGDSITNSQPEIRYVWLIDTLTQVYRYNAKGLLIKISKKLKDDIYERTETFEYDEKNRLIRSVISDQFLYKYYYNDASLLVKKEKYTNSYIDDSGIGPDLKPESTRLKKAVWYLTTTYQMTYDVAGRLTQNLEFSRFQGAATLTENHFYDLKGRLIQTTSRQEFADAYIPLCRIDYKYE